MDHQPAWTNGPLGAAVVAHLAVSLLHGTAHAVAGVPLSIPAMLFVFIVILGGPLVGMAMRAWTSLPGAGAVVVAVSMGGALVFGFVNHFVLDGGDHVGHVAGPGHGLFTVTAALLVATEAFGAGLATLCAVRTRRLS